MQGVDLMYSPLEDVFRETMRREGRTVTAVTSGAEFQAFMRRTDDGSSTEDRVTFYYAIDAPVSQGNLVKLGRKTYIFINRETEENSCYFKSYAVATNGEITINKSEKYIHNLKCYGYDLQSGPLANDNYISLISGTMEFITEDNEMSRDIKVSRTFNNYGRTWLINNIYYKDGICHIITKVDSDYTPQDLYTIEIYGLNPTYEVGDSTTLTAKLYLNGVEQSIESENLKWKSSSDDIATIDEESGTVNFKGVGSVTFTAKYNSYIIKTASCNVVESAIEIPYTANLSGSTRLRVNFKKTWTAVLTDSDGSEVSDVKWEFNIDSKFEISKTVSGNQVTLLIEDINAVDEVITLTATAANYDNAAAALNITIISPYYY